MNLTGAADRGSAAAFSRLKPSPSAAASDFPAFRSTASDQLARSASDRFAAIRLKLRGAFTPAQPIVDRRMFAGRKELVSSIINSIEDQRLHTIIYGDRGIGKTSTLHVLAQAAREARYLVIYVSCAATTTFDEMLRAVAAETPLLYQTGYGPTSPEAERGATLADILPEGPISVRTASELCAKLTGTRALVFLDEFDRSESVEFRRNVADFLKNLSDRSARVQLVIAGVAANLTEMIAEIPSIQRNIFALQVPKMNPEEVRQLVRRGEEAAGLTFSEEAVEFIALAADGLPYIASLLSQHAGLSALQDQRLTVEGDDVSAAIADTLIELNGRHSRRAQDQVAILSRDGAYKAIGPLASLTKLSSGVFTDTDIDKVFPSPELAARCRTVLSKLVASNKLLESFEDEFGQQYRFMESTVPQYLWLLTVQSRYLESHGTAAVGTKAAR